MVFSVNQTVSIWCSAEKFEAGDPRVLQALYWGYNNGTRIYPQGNPKNLNSDVYMERVAGARNADYTTTWRRVLHFSRIQPSYAGTLICVANYAKNLMNQTVVVQVSSE